MAALVVGYRMRRSYDEYIQELDRIRKTAPDQSEYWMARDLQQVLAYDTWRGFEAVIEKARTSCESVGANPDNHFAQTSKMIELGKGAERKIADWFLSRYACYLIP